jgi:AraC family transcriptional regulator
MTPIEPVRYEDGPPMLLAGLRRHFAFDEVADGIPALWRELHALGPVPNRTGGAAFGVICSGDPETRRMEYMAAVEVSAFDPDAPQAGRMRVPPQHYAVFEHVFGTLRETWDAIYGDWLPRSGRTPVHGPDFERYADDADPAAATGGVEIWFPVEPLAEGSVDR